MYKIKLFSFLLIIANLTQSLFAQAGGAVRPTPTKELVQQRLVSDVSISPDGRWVAAGTHRSDVDTNSTWDKNGEVAIYINEADGGRRTVKLDGGYAKGGWSPDSQSFAYMVFGAWGGLRVRRLSDGSERVLIDQAGFEAALKGFEAKSIQVRFMKWSPDGTTIAVTVWGKMKTPEGTNPDPKPSPTAESMRSQEYEMDPSLPSQIDAAVDTLFAVDVQSGRATALTNGRIHVRSTVGTNAHDWLQDNSQIVFTGRAQGEFDRHSADRKSLYVVGRDGKGLRKLTDREGVEDTAPTVSPDGKTIAFRRVTGIKSGDLVTSVWTVSVSGGDEREIKKDLPSGFLEWSADGHALYVTQNMDMGSPLFRLSLNGELKQLSPPKSTNAFFSLSKDKKTIAFRRESPAEPGDVWVSSLDFKDARRVTDLNPELRKFTPAKFEDVGWRSGDDKWDIHGFLVKPPDFVEGRKYPLVVVIAGGPSSFSREYDYSGWMAQALASRGYLVLAPVTRGRGGYGKEFADALRTEKMYLANAVHDVIPGVDLLIKRGIVDPDRVALGGHSYGAQLSAMTITRTDRFKAAYMWDPVQLDTLGSATKNVGTKLSRPEYGALFNIPELNSEVIKLLMEDSPIYWTHNVKTPTFMACGEVSVSMNNEQGLGVCKRFFGGLQSHKVPSELIVWPKAGHSPNPFAWAETIDRSVEWLDYWVRGIATERMSKRYGPPRIDRMAGTTANTAKPTGKN